MSATTAPNSYLPGIKKFTSDGSGAAAAATFANSTDYFAVPISAIPGLVFADTDPTTGDIRKILYNLAAEMFDAYTALPTADKPLKWVPGTSTQTTGSGTIQRVYSNRFTTTFTAENVAAE